MLRQDYIRVFDIGGSGVKTAVFERTARSNPELTQVGIVERLGKPSLEEYAEFAAWLAKRVPIQEASIGISCAGFVEPEAGRVRFSRVTGWYDHDLQRRMEVAFPGTRVRILNDAEAHLAAHRDIGSRAAHPQMCLALGTAPGLALSDARGNIWRTPGGGGFDVGHLKIDTRAADKEVSYALGSQGLAELVREHGAHAGVRQFGHRLGAFAARLASLFQPRSVALSGGLVAKHADTWKEPFVVDFTAGLPKWLEQVPVVYWSPIAAEAALWGMARYAAWPNDR